MTAAGSLRGVVPALDVVDLADALHLAERTAAIEGVAGFKIGQGTVLDVGLAQAVTALRAVTDLPLFYDHQKAGLDVPSNGPAFAAATAATGIDGVIVFPVAGPTAVREFVGSALAHAVRPIVGALLPLPDFTVSGGGWVVDDVLDHVGELAVAEGARDIVVPANDAGAISSTTERLAAQTDHKLTFFLPGIGALGGSIRSAFAAVRGGTPVAIVGRAIYTAADPAEATRRLAGEALDAVTAS